MNLVITDLNLTLEQALLGITQSFDLCMNGEVGQLGIKFLHQDKGTERRSLTIHRGNFSMQKLGNFTERRLVEHN